MPFFMPQECIPSEILPTVPGSGAAGSLSIFLPISVPCGSFLKLLLLELEGDGHVLRIFFLATAYQCLMNWVILVVGGNS